MGDTLDIHNILQTGYFTTSRARSASHRSPQRSPPLPSQEFPPQYNGVIREARVPRPTRRDYPPPPCVEDEAESLAKEHMAYASSTSSEDDPQSRGVIDQNPIMVEVHEFNPERRFVIVDNSTAATDDSTSEEDQAKRKVEQNKKPSGNGSRETTATRNEPDPKVHLEHPKPSINRRKSRQDLPPLETDVEIDGSTRRPHRSPSTAGASRPIYSATQSRQPGDDLLTPEVIKHGSGRREKAYYGYSQSGNVGSRSPNQRSQSTFTNDRRVDDTVGPKGPRNPSPPKNKRASSNFESDSSRRYQPEERQGEPRLRDDLPVRSSRRDTTNQYERGEGARLGDRTPQDTQSIASRRRKSIVVQDGDPIPDLDRDYDPRTPRSRSRVSTIPLPSPKPSDLSPKSPRSSATFPLPDEDARNRERPKAPLPYPEDDPFLWPQVEIPNTSDAALRARPTIPPAVPAHGVPLSTPNASDKSLNSTTPGTYSGSHFDSSKPAASRGPVGSYRRSSESKDQSERLPECPRTKPVVGMMDWLTLPRTDFNICPDCYEAVFAHSAYRTEFKPMLRPIDKEIACDFGSSPWYRIAWLLTLRRKNPDLRVFYHIADLMVATSNQPCPGTRRATRNWFTVRDPSTRKPVPGFTACYQCTKMVEALLPNLNGAFVSNSRAEPSRGMCALHFTPERARFTLYFDAMETISLNASEADRLPKIDELAQKLAALTAGDGCQEDNPINNGRWHIMQYLPEFTVCGECFEEVVRPWLNDDNSLARNFYMKPQHIPQATCQLYSDRMREIFKRSCRRGDPIYLEDKVKQRMEVEAEIHAKLVRLDKEGRDHDWTKEQVKKLIQEWQRWE